MRLSLPPVLLQLLAALFHVNSSTATSLNRRVIPGLPKPTSCYSTDNADSYQGAQKVLTRDDRYSRPGALVFTTRDEDNVATDPFLMYFPRSITLDYPGNMPIKGFLFIVTFKKAPTAYIGLYEARGRTGCKIRAPVDDEITSIVVGHYKIPISVL